MTQEEMNKQKDERQYYDAEVVKETAPYYTGKRQEEYTIEDYYALPDEQRVELINGVFYDMAAPTLIHQLISGKIYRVLDEFVCKRKGTCTPFIAPIDVQLDCDERTILQPDVVVVCEQDKLTNRCIYGAPDLVVEVLSKSTKRKDMFLKLAKYKNAGVKEYWMVDPEKRTVLIYDFWHDDEVKIYGFDSTIPIAIFDGDCQINFQKIYDEISFMYEKRN